MDIVIVSAIIFLIVITISDILFYKYASDLHLKDIKASLTSEEETQKVLLQNMKRLPMAAQKFLEYSKTNNVETIRHIECDIIGKMKPNPTTEFTVTSSSEYIQPLKGFIWFAQIAKSPIHLAGADYYHNKEAAVNFDIFNIIPFMKQSGKDTAKSALGRLFLETILFFPPAILLNNVSVEEVDDTTFTVSTTIDETTLQGTFYTDKNGRLLEMIADRWGNVQTPKNRFMAIPYKARIIEYKEFNGFNIPSEATAGWWAGTDKYAEIIQIEITSIQYIQ